jgi:hypothetical protein
MQSDKPGQLIQVWFPGGHGCVGGGSQQERGLSDRPLEWMLNHVSGLNLSVDTRNVEYGKTNGDIEYGVKPMYNAPFKLATSPLGYKSRELPEGSSTDDLDLSALKRWNDKTCNYRPANLEHKLGSALDTWVARS